MLDKDMASLQVYNTGHLDRRAVEGEPQSYGSDGANAVRQDFQDYHHTDIRPYDALPRTTLVHCVRQRLHCCEADVSYAAHECGR